MRSTQREKARMQERYNSFKAAGLCPQCGNRPAATGTILCSDCNEKRREWHRQNRARSNANALARRQRMWQTVLGAYGRKCACCSEAHDEFLTIDHVGGGGKAHRKEMGTTAAMLNWIIKNGFPSSIRILCMNCNLSYGVRGYCPHQKEK